MDQWVFKFKTPLLKKKCWCYIDFSKTQTSCITIDMWYTLYTCSTIRYFNHLKTKIGNLSTNYTILLLSETLIIGMVKPTWFYDFYEWKSSAWLWLTLTVLYFSYQHIFQDKTADLLVFIYILLIAEFSATFSGKAKFLPSPTIIIL